MSDTSSFQLINVGAVPNDGTGDDIRDAFIKINSNFSNIVAIGENVGNLKVAGFANIAGNINLSGYLNVVGNVNYSSSNVITFQTFSVIGTTDSTTPTNGALVVAGGAGVVKNLHVGGTVTAAGFYGTISTTNQPSINQLGTLVSLNVGGSTTFHNVVYANTAMNSSNVYTGAMVIAGGIGLTGNLNLTGGIGAGGTLGQNGQFLVSSGMGIAWSNAPIASTLIYGATSVTTTANFANIGVNGTNIASFSNTSLTIYSNATAIINGASNGVGNIGASGATFNTVFAKATTAQYADLAEKYLSDQNYECGTVVMVGGTQEVTASKFGFRAIGVVSTNPAYMMNSELEGGTYIALKGRVPVKVTGKVSKGDSLIGADNGLALSASGIIAPNMVFAIALEDNDNGWIDVIEAIIL